MIKRSGGDVRRQSGMDIGDGYGYRDRGVWLGGGRGLRGSWQSCLSDPDSRDTVYRRRACFSPPSPFGKSADGVSMLPGAPARPPALSRARLTRICMSHFAVVGACWAGCNSGHTNLSADPQTALVGALPDGPALWDGTGPARRGLGRPIKERAFGGERTAFKGIPARPGSRDPQRADRRTIGADARVQLTAGDVPGKAMWRFWDTTGVRPEDGLPAAGQACSPPSLDDRRALNAMNTSQMPFDRYFQDDPAPHHVPADTAAAAAPPPAGLQLQLPNFVLGGPPTLAHGGGAEVLPAALFGFGQPGELTQAWLSNNGFSTE
jgi:hypothetical protein